MAPREAADLPRRVRPHEVERSTLSRDTDPRAEAVQIEIFRAMPPWQKAKLVEEAIKAGHELALAGLRERHPRASASELRRRLFGLMLGEELATKVYGPLESAMADRVAP